MSQALPILALVASVIVFLILWGCSAAALRSRNRALGDYRKIVFLTHTHHTRDDFKAEKE